MLQFKNIIAPNLTENIFIMRSVEYNLRNDAGFESENVQTLLFGTEAVPSLYSLKIME